MRGCVQEGVKNILCSEPGGCVLGGCCPPNPGRRKPSCRTGGPGLDPSEYFFLEYSQTPLKFFTSSPGEEQKSRKGHRALAAPVPRQREMGDA